MNKILISSSAKGTVQESAQLAKNLGLELEISILAGLFDEKMFYSKMY